MLLFLRKINTIYTSPFEILHHCFHKDKVSLFFIVLISDLNIKFAELLDA